jgi:hypothetical protein
MKNYYALAIIPLILAYPVYSWLSPTESLEQKQMRLIEEQNTIIRETNNTKLERYRLELIECISTASGEILSELDACKKRPKPILQELVGTITWTASGAIVPPPERQGKLWDTKQGQQYTPQRDVLWELHVKVCKKQINSPLCKDRQLFDRLYRLTEERLPWMNFYPILIGITNAESSLWLNFAKDKVGGTCTWRNNWWWVKWKINDDMSREFSNNGKFGYNYSKQKQTDDYGCWLYPFDSIEEYWISKVNTFRFYYKGCLNHKTPIWCISWPYVGKREVHEQSWINNVSEFLIN